MKFSVELTQQAKADLLNIAQYYLSKAGIDVAASIVDTLEVKVQSLSEHPERGHKPHEIYQVSNGLIFEIISGHYRIIYKLMAQRVVIIAIFDGRQDVKSHLTKRLTSLH
jgi:toxin ParE1/3/4